MKQKATEPELKPSETQFLLLECLFWFYHLTVLLLGLFLLYNVAVGYQLSQTQIGSNAYQHAVETVWFWKQGYVLDIKSVNTNNCPEGYQPLINYTWSGSNEGCYCSTVVNSHTFDFVMLGTCSSDLVGYKCINVATISAQPLNMWKGAKLLCVKRAPGLSFYNSTLATVPVTGGNMTVCAAGASYQVSTLPGVSCPLTATSNSSLGASQTNIKLDLSDNFNYISQQGYPIAGFKLTEYSFCEFWGQLNISPNKTGSYILEEQVMTTPCSSTDPRMVEFDSMTEEALYTNNTRVYALISQLPAYPRPSVSYTYKLGYVAYPAWTYQCRASTVFSLQAAANQILLNDVLAAIKLAVAVAMPCILIFAVILRLFFTVRRAIELKSRIQFNAVLLTEEQVSEQIPTLNLKKSYRCELSVFLFEMALRVGLLAVMACGIQVTTYSSLWIKQMANYKCTDTYVMNLFRSNEVVVDSIAGYLLQGAIVWCFLVVFDVAFWLVRLRHGDLSFKVEQLEEVKADYDVMKKEMALEGHSMSESSNMILHQDKEQMKIYDIDQLGDFNLGETKDNFFGENQDFSPAKKKKKRLVKKKKNLFKDDP